jgi:hypothetical protein
LSIPCTSRVVLNVNLFLRFSAPIPLILSKNHYIMLLYNCGKIDGGLRDSLPIQ